MMHMATRLELNAEAECRRIEVFLAQAIADLGKKGAVIGLSGGLDSAVVAYLCVRALSPSKVLGLILPERDSDPQNIADAWELAQRLGIETEELDLTPLLEQIGIYKLIPRWAAKQEKLIRGMYQAFKMGKGTHYLIHSLGPVAERREFHFSSFIQPKLRLRMILLYYHAGLRGYAVIGTTNRTEWEVGHYDRYGDGACDIELIKHLYKTQVKELAKYLQVPERIIEKPASPDLIAGITDELTLGMSFEQLDQILFLLSQGLSDEEIAERVGIDRRAAKEAREAVEWARRMRELPRAISPSI
jgi:NAD+ synthase